MKNKIRVLAIAPYTSLKNTLERISHNRTDIELTVDIGLLKEGAYVLQKYNLANFDVILSRGGTMLEIKKVTDKPVFEIPITHLDILGIITLVENYVGKIAIVVYENIKKPIDLICDILHYDYDIFVIKSLSDSKNLLKELKNKDYTLIIGDAVATMHTADIGLQTLLITSGPLSINQAFDNIVNIYSYFITSSRQNSIYNTFVNSHNLHFLVLDSDGTIIFNTYNNSKHEAIYTCRSMLKSIQIESDSAIISHKRLSEGFFMIHASKEILMDSTYYFFNIRRSKFIHSQINGFKDIEIYNYHYLQEMMSEDYFNSRKIHHSIWKQLDLFVKSNTSILITSEPGTKKDKLALQIYLDSLKHSAPYYIINCINITPKELDNILNNDKSPIYTLYATIHFKDIHLLNNDLKIKLLNSLNDMSWMLKSRFIFTYELSQDPILLEKNLNDCNLIKIKTGSVEISIPPLADSTDMIANLSILCIYYQNLNNKSQFVGIEPEAYEIMYSYDWPGNFEQLQHVLNEAMLLCPNSKWITSKSIKKILLTEERTKTNINLNAKINTKQTMDNIIYDIVKIVLEEENLNQVKTAKRLGISRTTLWRILKNNSDDKKL